MNKLLPHFMWQFFYTNNKTITNLFFKYKKVNEFA